MITIIIPTYNREKTILRSVKSVLTQTYSDIEVIVVDDCSTDNTKKLINSISDKRLRYICHEENQGACAARNTGILLARGKYIAFQDSDDVWLPDKLQIQIDQVLKYDADICFCSMHRHGFPETMSEYAPDYETGVVPYETLIAKTGPSTQTIVAKREVFLENMFDIEVRRMQDYDWIIRAGEKNKVLFVKEAVVDTYLQSDSISNMGMETIVSSIEYFLKKYENKFNTYPEFYSGLLDKLGFYKTKLGKNASAEYRTLYELKKNPRTWLRWFLARIGVLKIAWRHKKV